MPYLHVKEANPGILDKKTFPYPYGHYQSIHWLGLALYCVLLFHVQEMNILTTVYVCLTQFFVQDTKNVARIHPGTQQSVPL